MRERRARGWRPAPPQERSGARGSSAAAQRVPGVALARQVPSPAGEKPAVPARAEAEAGRRGPIPRRAEAGLACRAVMASRTGEDSHRAAGAWASPGPGKWQAAPSPEAASLRCAPPVPAWPGVAAQHPRKRSSSPPVFLQGTDPRCSVWPMLPLLGAAVPPAILPGPRLPGGKAALPRSLLSGEAQMSTNLPRTTRQVCKEVAQPTISLHCFLGVFYVNYTVILAVCACG